LKQILKGRALQVIFRKAPGAPYLAILSRAKHPDLEAQARIQGYEVLACPAKKKLWQKMKRSGATHVHKFRRDTGEVIYVLVMREDSYQEMQRLKKERKQNGDQD